MDLNLLLPWVLTSFSFASVETEDLVKRVFGALKDKSYLPKQAQSTEAAAAATTSAPSTMPATAPTPNANSSETNKSTEDKDDDEDDEDDDTNFKRRSNNKSSSTAEAKDDGPQTQKRSFSADDNTDNGPLNKQQRHHSPGGQNVAANYPMQQRLGPRQFVKKPCFNYQSKDKAIHKPWLWRLTVDSLL